MHTSYNPRILGRFFTPALNLSWGWNTHRTQRRWMRNNIPWIQWMVAIGCWWLWWCFVLPSFDVLFFPWEDSVFFFMIFLGEKMVGGLKGIYRLWEWTFGHLLRSLNRKFPWHAFINVTVKNLGIFQKCKNLSPVQEDSVLFNGSSWPFCFPQICFKMQSHHPWCYSPTQGITISAKILHDLWKGNLSHCRTPIFWEARHLFWFPVAKGKWFIVHHLNLNLNHVLIYQIIYKLWYLEHKPPQKNRFSNLHLKIMT